MQMRSYKFGILGTFGCSMHRLWFFNFAVVMFRTPSSRSQDQLMCIEVMLTYMTVVMFQVNRIRLQDWPVPGRPTQKLPRPLRLLPPIFAASVAQTSFYFSLCSPL